MPHKRLALQKKVDFRLHLWRAFVIVAFLALGGGLFFFQIVQGDWYIRLAADNRFRLLRITPPRGIVYESHGLPLAKNVRTFAIKGYPLDLYKEGALERVARVFLKHGIPFTAEQLLGKVKKQYWAPYRAVSLATNLSLMQVMGLMEDPDFPPWLFLFPLWKRIYPGGELTAHVTGYVGEVTLEELQGEGSRGYTVGEQIGKNGVESYYDYHLRGSVGEEAIEVDAKGRRLHLLARRDPLRGKDLHLTLNLGAQKVAKSLLGRYTGAVFAMDVITGDVLVLYSSPSYDPNLLSWGASPQEWQKIRNNQGRPMMNRVLGGYYPPASPFKIVPAIAGVASGILDGHTRSFCSGSYQVGNRKFRCWQKWGHGSETLVEALRDSCDIFFYTQGLTMGIDIMHQWATRLGLGAVRSIDLPGELSGNVAGPGWKEKIKKEPWYPGDTVNYSIGQGFLLATPLQIGVLYGVIANGGYLVEPRLAFIKPPSSIDVKLPAKALELVRKGLLAVCRSGGTGYRAGTYGVTVAGKTGTAQNPHGADHAWFVGYAPAEKPQYVAVVLVEGGEHGSSVAAPMVGELLSYLCKGYLEDKEE